MAVAVKARKGMLVAVEYVTRWSGVNATRGGASTHVILARVDKTTRDGKVTAVRSLNNAAYKSVSGDNVYIIPADKVDIAELDANATMHGAEFDSVEEMRQYVRRFAFGAMKSNPAPRAPASAAAARYRRFTGMAPERALRVDYPKNPVAGLAVGPCLEVAYETVRDGVVERYRHKFAPNARPTLVASHDGRQLYLLGGAYRFTDRGIVDARPKRKG